MSSLQEQLLKAGLTTKDKANKVKSEKRKKAKISRKHKLDVEDENRAAAEKLLAEKAEKDRQLNQQRNAELAQKELVAQVKQIIETNQQDYGKPVIQYRFSDNGVIKQIEVSNEVHRHLSNGLLGIASLQNDYFLLPKPVVEKIQQRAPEFIITLNEKNDEFDEEDPYADYQIPDDLMW
ncbi:DUF2058 domain-containing protein [Aliikangiella sp. IMCC44359]|uniref:DUF2058 domain-containing protein n=1 Tax=Aliikangiella sp. IMCC44359 TaxID=3459125 RepID=UPI00403AD338